MSKAITRYFQALAVIATLLLWGVSVWNGTVKALLLAVFHGRMSDEIPLHTKYTGIPIIDLPIALLVAFFYHGTNGEDEGYNLFLVDAYSTLQSAFVWLYVEMARNGSKPKWVTTPVVFGIMWQCFGAAISLPLYYSIHAPWALAADRNGPLVEAVRDARAIPFSFLLGAICPAVVGMLPTWLGPAYRSARQHQVVLAAWQPDPLWVAGLFALLSGLGSTRSQGKDHSIRSSYRWIRASYVLAAICSATGHVLVVAKMASGRADPKLGFTRMYVPFLFGGPAETTGILTRGPFLFLQYDLIIIALSSLSWAYVLYSKKLKVQGLQHLKLAVCMAIGTVTIGPGATVSLTLLARESSTFHEFNLQHEKTS